MFEKLMKSNFYIVFLILGLTTISITVGVFYFTTTHIHILQNRNATIRPSLNLAKILPDSTDWYKFKKVSNSYLSHENQPWMADIQYLNCEFNHLFF